MKTAEKLCNIFSIMAGILAILLLCFYWPSLPQIVPVHFNIFGEVDAYGNKIMVLLFCLLGCFIVFILSNIERFPSRINYPFALTECNCHIQAEILHKFLIFFKLEIVYLFLYIEVNTMVIAFKWSYNLGPVLMYLLLALAVTTFIYLYKAYQNR